ncbi:MAG: zinc ribbon domain-containing protein [Bryobacteraceae bacterium]
MPDSCTCGAQLPPDARFCHKCGKPQRDEPMLVDEVIQAVVNPPVEIPTIPIDAPPVINLRNGPAVRSALLACGLALLLSVVLGPLGLGLLALVGGGFFAVFLYRRKTGQPVSVLNGIRLGWISGIFVFTLITLVTTMTVAALSQPELAAQLRDQMLKSSYPADEVTALFEGLQNPSGIGLRLLDGFLSSTLLMGLGAAVGAKLLSRN